MAKALKLERNGEMSVSEYEKRLKNDPLKGNFDPGKDFLGEIYNEAKVPNFDPVGERNKFIKGVRITRCPYSKPDGCPWLLLSHDGQRKICTAVLCDDGMAWEESPMCKAHVSRRDRLDVEG